MAVRTKDDLLKCVQNAAELAARVKRDDAVRSRIQQGAEPDPVAPNVGISGPLPGATLPPQR